MTHDYVGPSPTKKKHLFKINDAPNNAPPEELDGTHTWGLDNTPKNKYGEYMTQFVMDESKKLSDKAMKKAEEYLNTKKHNL